MIDKNTHPTIAIAQKSTTRNLTIRYIVSLSIVGCLSILGQVVIQRSLAQQEANLKVVSLAQRQQMFSQKLSRDALVLLMSTNPQEKQEHLQEIQTIITHWKSSRQELEKMAADSHLSNECVEQVERILQQKTPKLMQQAAQDLMSLSPRNRLVTNSSLLTLPSIGLLKSASKEFVGEMDNIILTYNQQATAEVKRMKSLEIGLLSLTLLILGFEGIFIFHPAVKKIHQALSALQKSLRETQETAQKLATEQEKSEHLLLNILPEPIVQRLKDKPTAIADGFAEVTVLFADIVGFTQLSTLVSPQELVALLNRIFSAFDRLAENYGLEKIKTIGDAYMVVGGLPNPRPDHAEATVEMALEMQAVMSQFNQETGLQCSIRIGINTGPVVAGVIGIKKFIYDLWGDTVNTASRMESHGVPGGIQVTQTTYQLLKDKYLFTERGVMEIKGKGEMETYLVTGKIDEREPVLKV